jgi:predicted RNA-binding protein with RPS1 domain
MKNFFRITNVQVRIKNFLMMKNSIVVKILDDDDQGGSAKLSLVGKISPDDKDSRVKKSEFEI